MFKVKWIEDGKNLEKAFANKDEAFMFQDELLIRKFDNKNVKLEIKGVWA